MEKAGVFTNRDSLSKTEKVFDAGAGLTAVFLLGVALTCIKGEIRRINDGEFWKPIPIERLSSNPTPQQLAATETKGLADVGVLATAIGTLLAVPVLEVQRRHDRESIRSQKPEKQAA